MTLEELTQKAAGAVTAGGDFTKKVKFDFGDTGKLFIDGAAGNVDNSDSEADATIKVDWEDFRRRDGPDHGVHARQAESAGRHVGRHAASGPDVEIRLIIQA